MIPGFHGFDLIVILIVALLIFGPKRLPEMGSAIGKSIKEFRKGMNELGKDRDTKDEHVDEPMTPIATRDINRLSSSSVNNDLLHRETVRETVHEPVIGGEVVSRTIESERRVD